MPSSYLLDRKSLDEQDYPERALDRGTRTPARIEAFLLHVMTTLLSTETEVPGTAPARLSNACEAMHDRASLLEDTRPYAPQWSQPILDLALACGIENLSHFHRLFRQTHGVSPRRYRRRQQIDLVVPWTGFLK